MFDQAEEPRGKTMGVGRECEQNRVWSPSAPRHSSGSIISGGGREEASMSDFHQGSQMEYHLKERIRKKHSKRSM